MLALLLHKCEENTLQETFFSLVVYRQIRLEIPSKTFYRTHSVRFSQSTRPLLRTRKLQLSLVKLHPVKKDNTKVMLSLPSQYQKKLTLKTKYSL